MVAKPSIGIRSEGNLWDVMKIWDVIVVGAGPAGSTAAYYAAKEGASVLLIDKKDKIGLPVKCGEYYLTENEIKNIFPKVANISELFFDIPKSVIMNKTRILRFVSPFGERYDSPSEAYIIDREKFDYYLAQKAIASGVILKHPLRAVALTNEGITAKNKSGSETFI